MAQATATPAQGEAHGRALDGAQFVWLVGSLCRINHLPFDPRLLLQRFPAPHSVRQLHEALKALGFRTGESACNPGKLRLPCVAFLKREPSRPAILVKRDAERTTYFQAGSPIPDTVANSDLAETFGPTAILVRHEAAAEPTGDGAEAPGKFGFRWFWAELLKHRRVCRAVIAASLFIQLLGFATPLGTQVVIDKVVVHQTQSTLVAIAVGLAMFMIFNAVMTWLRQYFLIHTGNRVDAVLGNQVFRHILRLYLPYFEHRPTGVLVARVHAVETIRDFLAGAAVSLLLDLPFLLIFVAVMFFYSWQLTLIALGMLGLVAALSLGVTPTFRARLNRQFLLGARNQAFLTEYVSGIETVKSLQMEPRLEERYDEILANYLDSSFATRTLSNTYNVAANALEQVMTLAILCVGALLVMRNDGFTIGMLVAFQMFASRMSQPMLRLAGLWQEFQQANIAIKRLGDIMDAPVEPYTLVPSRAGESRGEVAIRGLGFRYSPGHPWLFRGLDLGLKPGKLTVLTGPSGSGKSTLSKLLLGFYQPEEGKIEIDGRDLRHFSANELRQNFGIVPQETYLFSGTIYENLIAANPNAGFPDVVQAAKIAEIHDVIERLPKGYNTEIGEHGVGLSGGQKQRLAITRAILKRPKILVFDEATSSLDPATAEQFAQTVNQLKGRVTTLFIAHQVPRGLQVDEVVRLGERVAQIKVIEEESI
ncbi:MAG TPA: peptidase domain-containing ABC transporter [Burkholderiales bacterium]|nr:peptidase domain-containing ABC transporter [Burkholderiales bacterium]